MCCIRNSEVQNSERMNLNKKITVIARQYRDLSKILVDLLFNIIDRRNILLEQCKIGR